MKVQRVDMFVCPMASPSDTSGLQKLAGEGKIRPETLVALVGKTEGTARTTTGDASGPTSRRTSSSCCRADAPA